MPDEAKAAFEGGDDRAALRALRRVRDLQEANSPRWAFFERLLGLVLIHTLREVEGTFALERADAILDAHGWARPTLDALRDS